MKKFKQLKYIGSATMYQIRKSVKEKRQTIKLENGVVVAPNPNDVVLVNDKRAFKVVQYVYTSKDTGFQRLKPDPVVKVDFATTRKETHK